MTSASVAYLDASAFLKLVTWERETRALAAYLRNWPHRASALLLRTEAVRALRRADRASSVRLAIRLMRGMQLIRLDETLLDETANLDPRELRSLDAIHVAAALTLGEEVGVFVTYDERLRAAAAMQGLPLASPR